MQNWPNISNFSLNLTYFYQHFRLNCSFSFFNNFHLLIFFSKFEIYSRKVYFIWLIGLRQNMISDKGRGGVRQLLRGEGWYVVFFCVFFWPSTNFFWRWFTKKICWGVHIKKNIIFFPRANSVKIKNLHLGSLNNSGKTLQLIRAKSFV